MKEKLQEGVVPEGNIALDLMVFLLTREFGSGEKAREKIKEWSATYENDTIAALALCSSRGVDVIGALERAVEYLKSEGLISKTSEAGRPEDRIPYVWTKVELDAYIQRKMPEWIKELQTPTRR